VENLKWKRRKTTELQNSLDDLSTISGPELPLNALPIIPEPRQAAMGAARPAWMCGLLPQDKRRNHWHLNEQAAVNCPISGPYQRAGSSNSKCWNVAEPMAAAEAQNPKEVTADQSRREGREDCVQNSVHHEAGEKARFSEDGQVREWETGLQKVSKADEGNDIAASFPEDPQGVQFTMTRSLSTDCRPDRSQCQESESELRIALETESEHRTLFIAFATEALVQEKRLSIKQLVAKYCRENQSAEPRSVLLFFSTARRRGGTREYLTLKMLKSAARKVMEERRLHSPNNDQQSGQNVSTVHVDSDDESADVETGAAADAAAVAAAAGAAADAAAVERESRENKERIRIAQERKSILDQMATVYKEFNNPTAQAQLDSLLEDAQELGVRLIRQSGSGGGFASVVLGEADSSMVRGVLPGQKLALVFERRKRSSARLYNGLLFRYAQNITLNRKRKAFDKFIVQPVRLFKNGTSCFSVSYPDEKGESICCLVLEGLENGYIDGLQHDTDSCPLAERLRCDMQHTLYALNTFHDNSIVHHDIKPSNMMRNSKGHVVFINWGSGWSFAGPGALVQRRATSIIHSSSDHRAIKGCSKKTLQALNVGRRVKETAVKKHLPLQRLRRGKCSKAPQQNQAKDNQSFRSRIPDERKPSYLSDCSILGMMRSLEEKGAALATLGSGSELFRREDLWHEGEKLTLERAVKQDVYALFRTFMMLFRPLGSMSHTQWEREATLAAKSVSSMQKFLLDGDRVALQPRAMVRLADFLFRGITDLNPKESQTHAFVTLPIYHEAIERSIFQQTGYLVKGGEMCTVLGCPFPTEKLKDVLVIKEREYGAGLRALEAYEKHELITFYFAAERVGLEINEDPPGRFIVAIQPHAWYANGEFTPELTVEQFAEKKAMGVCINAATNSKSRNCYLMRIHTKSDAANSKYLWIPLRAARRIEPGEYFSYTYNHEAGGGTIRGYSFK
jgi:serine/threonine protein kinase/ribosomal protein L32